MDFGVGFLSNNVMLPILDFFYGIAPSYGLAIIALTLVIRFALLPLSAGSIRSMRRMRVAQPVMQKRIKELQERYKDDKVKLQEEMQSVYQEFGNPLSGCLPLLVQMPLLFALFATLRGSPFSDAHYTINFQVVPAGQVEQVQPFTSAPQNVFIADGVHYPVVAVLPAGNRIPVGDTAQITFQAADGKPFTTLAAEFPDSKVTPHWEVTKGQERVKLNPDGSLTALEAGDVTVQGTIPGLAADRGFLFIDALGRSNPFDSDGQIHWDIVGMILFFGLSLYLNQTLSGQGQTTNANPQQELVSKLTPILFSGMFFFVPLPAGVLMYMVVANIFQTLQTFIIMREPLPDNLQKLVDAQAKAKDAEATAAMLPFEPKSSKKKTAS